MVTEEVLELINKKNSNHLEAAVNADKRLNEIMDIPEVLVEIPKLLKASNVMERKIYSEFLMNSIEKNWASNIYDKYKANFIKETLKLLENSESDEEKKYLFNSYIFICTKEDIRLWYPVLKEASNCLKNKTNLVSVIDFYIILHESKAYPENIQEISFDEMSYLLKMFAQKIHEKDYNFISSFQKFLCTAFIEIMQTISTYNFDISNILYDVLIELVDIDLYDGKLDEMKQCIDAYYEGKSLDLKSCILILIYNNIEKVLVVSINEDKSYDASNTLFVRNTVKTKKLVQSIIKDLKKIHRNVANNLYDNQNLLDYSFICFKIILSIVEEYGDLIFDFEEDFNFLIFDFMILIHKFTNKDKDKLEKSQKEFLLSLYDQSENIKMISKSLFQKIIQIYHEVKSFECNKIIYTLSDCILVYNNEPNERNASLAYGFVYLLTIALRTIPDINYNKFVEKSLFPLINSKHLFLQYMIFDCLAYFELKNLEKESIIQLLDLYIERIKNEEDYIIVQALNVLFLFFSYENVTDEWREKVVFILEKTIKARVLYGKDFDINFEKYLEFVDKRDLEWIIGFNDILIRTFLLCLKKKGYQESLDQSLQSSLMTKSINKNENETKEDAFIRYYLLFTFCSLNNIIVNNLNSFITLVKTDKQGDDILEENFDYSLSQYLLSRSLKILNFFNSIGPNIVEATEIIISKNMKHLYKFLFKFFNMCAFTTYCFNEKYFILLEKITDIVIKENDYYDSIGCIFENTISNIKREDHERLIKIIVKFLKTIDFDSRSKSIDESMINIIFNSLLYFRVELLSEFNFFIKSVNTIHKSNLGNYEFTILYIESLLVCFIVDFEKTREILLSNNELEYFLKKLYSMKEKLNRVFDKKLVLLFFGSLMRSQNAIKSNLFYLKRHIPFSDFLQYKEVDFSIWIYGQTANIELEKFKGEKYFNIKELNEILFSQIISYQKALNNYERIYNKLEVTDHYEMEERVIFSTNPLMNFDVKNYFSENLSEIGNYMVSMMTKEQKNMFDAFIKK